MELFIRWKRQPGAVGWLIEFEFLQSGRFDRVVLYIFSVNVGCGPAEERVLLTGLHAVADIFCECCKTTLGWKYVS